VVKTTFDRGQNEITPYTVSRLLCIGGLLPSGQGVSATCLPVVEASKTFTLMLRTKKLLRARVFLFFFLSLFTLFFLFLFFLNKGGMGGKLFFRFFSFLCIWNDFYSSFFDFLPFTPS